MNSICITEPQFVINRRLVAEKRGGQNNEKKSHFQVLDLMR